MRNLILQHYYKRISALFTAIVAANLILADATRPIRTRAMLRLVVSLLVSLLLFGLVEPTSFTFELPDGESRCFYAKLKKDERTTVEFQVNIVLLLTISIWLLAIS